MKTYRLKLKCYGITLEEYVYGSLLNPDEIVEKLKLSLNWVGRLLIKLHIFKIEVEIV